MSHSQYLSCSYAHLCSGCAHLYLSQDQVRQLRIQNLVALEILQSPGDPRIDFQWISAGHLRDRLEFTYEPGQNGNKALGLYAKAHESNGNRRPLIDIEGCPQLSQQLESWLQEFRRDLPPLKQRAGIRLRVSPAGLRGVWIDASNEDIRDLLDEGQWLLRQLQKDIVVEAGQKRKRVMPLELPTASRTVGLTDAVLEAWYETSANPTIKVFGSIGTFTQPGFHAGKKLIETVSAHVDHLASPQTHCISELGAGSGTFTLANLAKGFQIRAYEFDELAVAALKKGLAESGLKKENLEVVSGDFIQSAKAFDLAESKYEKRRLKEVLLVDPPRTGLGSFLEGMLNLERCSNASWIYVSCFPESFAKDLKRLRQFGFDLKKLSIVEQFPYTSHYEIVATIELLRENA